MATTAEMKKHYENIQNSYHTTFVRSEVGIKSIWDWKISIIPWVWRFKTICNY